MKTLRSARVRCGAICSLLALALVLGVFATGSGFQMYSHGLDPLPCDDCVVSAHGLDPLPCDDCIVLAHGLDPLPCDDCIVSARA